MDLRRLVRWFGITALIATCTLCQQDMILMSVLVDGTNSGAKIVKFTEDLFTQFYNCLCNDRAVICTAYLKPFNQIIHRRDQRSDASCGDYSSFYNCTIPTSLTTMECNRLQQPTTPCDSTTLSTSFTLTGQTTNCNSSCVGFVWKNGKEVLHPSHPSLDFGTCQDNCYGVSTSTGFTTTSKPRTAPTSITQASSTTNMPMTTTSQMTSTLTHKTSTDRPMSTTSQKTSTLTTKISTDKSMSTTSQMTSTLTIKTSDDNITLMIGTVFGILAIFVMVIIVYIILCRRRRKSVQSKAKTHTVENNANASSNNRITMESKPYYVSDSTIITKESNFSVTEQTLTHGDVREKVQYSAWPTDSKQDTVTYNLKKVLKPHVGAKKSDNKHDTPKTLGVVTKSRDTEIRKTLGAPDHNLRLSDEFGYSNVVRTESGNSSLDLKRTNTTGKDIGAEQGHGVLATSMGELGTKTEQVRSNVDIKPGENSIDGNYDLATATDDNSVGSKDIRHSSDSKDELSDSTSTKMSANNSYDYYQIDHESSGAGHLIKPANLTTKKKTGEQFNASDYDYIESVEETTTMSSTQQETPVKKATLTSSDIDKIGRSTDSNDYSTVNETYTESKNVYSKLGEKKREITNPYNVLLQPEEDPKGRKQPPKPAHLYEMHNEQSPAQPHLNKSTELTEAVDVDPYSTKNIDSFVNQDNIPKTLHSCPMPEYAIVKRKNTPAKEERHIYFELEKEEDIEAEDYAVVYKKNKSTDKSDFAIN